MTTAPAALLAAMTAAIAQRALDALAALGALSDETRRSVARTARLDAQAAWDGLVGVSEVREEWICTGEPGSGFPPYRFTWPMPGQPPEDAREAATDFVARVAAYRAWEVGPDLHHRVVVATQPEPVTCCDMHNRHCEPPGDLCCGYCTEASHGFYGHTDGTTCVLAAAPPEPQP